jgi:GTP-binding protein HflX
VGFIRELPHKLVEAFEATLQEAADADLLLHVIDAASPQRDEQIADVQRVLREIGADGVPQVLVFNKLDRLETTLRPRELRDAIEGEAGVRTPRVFVSARGGEGIDLLRQVIGEAVAGAAVLNPASAASLGGFEELESPPADNPPTANFHTHASP